MNNNWNRYSPKLRKRRKDYMEKAGSVIRKIRKDAGLSQEEAGNLIEVSRQEISRYENGIVDMPYSALPVLIEDMGASVYDVMRGLLPCAKREFELCRDILMDMIAKSGMDVSVMNPMYPDKKEIYFSSYISRQKAGKEKGYVLHDPVIGVLDSINLVSAFGNDDDIKTVQDILFKSILQYLGDQ